MLVFFRRVKTAKINNLLMSNVIDFNISIISPLYKFLVFLVSMDCW